MGARSYKGYAENRQLHLLEPAKFPVDRVGITVTVEDERSEMPFEEWKALMDRLREESRDENHLLDEFLTELSESRQLMRTRYELGDDG